MIISNSDNVLSVPNQMMSGHGEEKMKQGDFDLNECAAVPVSERLIDPKGEESEMEQVQIENYGGRGVQVEHENERLPENVMEKCTSGDEMEGLNERSKSEIVKFELPHGDLPITRRVLRSSSAASSENHGRSDEHNVSLEDKISDIKGNLSGVNCCDEVKTEVKHKHVHSPKVEEVREADVNSEIKVEQKDSGSCDEDVNVVPHDVERKLKRKRGRPRKRKRGRPQKLQISSQSDDRGSSLKCEPEGSPYSCSQQSDIDGLNLRQHGGPTKTQNTVEASCIREKNMKRKRGRPPKIPNQNISDSVDESKRPKRKCRGSAKGPESDGGKCRGRENIVRKRGRPPKPEKERSSGKTDNSGSEANKNSKIHDSFSNSQANNPSADREMRMGGQETNQTDPGKQSRSGAKKLLRDRILELLLAAGWKVEYRPRNGRQYHDAVYINPEGKTHWSVTLAYKVYKEQVENCMSDKTNAICSSSFPLLSEEDLHILERKTQKKRCDIGKKRPKLEEIDGAEDMVTIKKSGKRKLHAKKLQKERLRMQNLKLPESYLGRPFQKKPKGSHLLQDLECISPLRVSKSILNKKREEKHTRKRCAPLARSALDDAISKDDGFTLCEGKRTVLGWMIDLAIVPLNGKVLCMNCIKTHVLIEGMITKEGILCDCCGEEFSIFDFEIHAGGRVNQPLESLYLEGGASLLQCLLDSWNKQDESKLKGFHYVNFGGGDPNDDTCGICGDGGDLICCDNCPATFHQSCLDINKFPSGSWFCSYCSCKFCGEVETANDDRTAQSFLLNCSLCEEKYHEACTRNPGKTSNDRSNYSFCGKNCQELFERLQLLIGVKQLLPEGFSWSFLRRFDLTSQVSPVEVSDKIVCNSKLAVAFSVMDECFSPLVDHRSGINLLQNIVYNFGSNFIRLNYSGFLTAILERGDEMIAVASIRIHGNQLAEMPFIGTRYMYRRQGMCRRLMSGIESVLCSLGVERLVIPAVAELTETWTSGFGFKHVDESSKKTIKNLNLMVFPGVDMLEKPLLKHNSADANMLSYNGSPPLVPEIWQQVDDKENKHEGMCSPRLDQGVPGPETMDNACDGTHVVEPPMHLADSCSSIEKNEDLGGTNDTESNVKSYVSCLEDQADMEKVIGKAIESHPKPAENYIGDGTNTPNEMENERKSRSLVIESNAESDVEMGSRVFDGCIGGEAEMTIETDLQDGCDIKELSQTVADGETGKERESKALPSALQTQGRFECSDETLPSLAETRTLENIVVEQKMHLFECQII